MTSMRWNVRPAPGPLQDPTDSGTGTFRDRIAQRSQRQDERYPRAVDLESRVVAWLHSALHGHAETLRGIHSGDHFRSVLLGEQPLHVSDLCRLATSDHPLGREAAVAVVRELASALALDVVPLSRRTTDAFEASAQVAETAGLYAATAHRAARDGVIDEGERADMLARINELEGRLACAKGALR